MSDKNLEFSALLTQAGNILDVLWSKNSALRDTAKHDRLVNVLDIAGPSGVHLTPYEGVTLLSKAIKQKFDIENDFFKTYIADEKVSALQATNKLNIELGFEPAPVIPLDNPIDDNLQTMVVTAINKDTSSDQNEDQRNQKIVSNIRNMIRSSGNPKYYLALFNEAQKRLPFLLLDVYKRKTQHIEYGYADLMRFLCVDHANGVYDKFHKVYLGSDKLARRVWDDNTNEYVLDSETNAPVMVNTNPLYNPIEYPIPDMEANKKLVEMMNAFRMVYHNQLKEAVQLVLWAKKLGKTKPDSEGFKNQMYVIMKVTELLQDIHDKIGNPVWLSMNSKEYERPMHKYNREHFYTLLKQLSTTKALAPSFVGDHPSYNTGISINVPNVGASRHSGDGVYLSEEITKHKKGKRVLRSKARKHRRRHSSSR